MKIIISLPNSMNSKKTYILISELAMLVYRYSDSIVNRVTWFISWNPRTGVKVINPLILLRVCVSLAKSQSKWITRSILSLGKFKQQSLVSTRYRRILYMRYKPVEEICQGLLQMKILKMVCLDLSLLKYLVGLD